MRIGGVPRIPIWSNIYEKALVDHFKKTSRAGRVYSMPLSFFAQAGGACGAVVHTLRDRLGMDDGGDIKLHELVSGSFMSGIASMLDAGEADSLVPIEESPPDVQRVFFSVIDATPPRARVIPLPPGSAKTLGPDDIQIVAHADSRSDNF